MTKRPHKTSAAAARTVAIALCAAGVLSGARASEPGPREGTPAAGARSAPRNLECTNLRRLSDNQLLDLKIRLLFRAGTAAYLRLENAGRGWQPVGERLYDHLTPTQLVLAETPAHIAYVERLTGDYYHIDRTGTGLSYWGRCVPVFGTGRAF